MRSANCEDGAVYRPLRNSHFAFPERPGIRDLTPHPNSRHIPRLPPATLFAGQSMGVLYGFFIVVLIIVSILLVAAVLLQAGKGGGMSASFGGASSSSDAIFGTRQAGNILTKSSWWLGGIFLALSFALQIA